MKGIDTGLINIKAKTDEDYQNALTKVVTFGKKLVTIYPIEKGLLVIDYENKEAVKLDFNTIESIDQILNILLDVRNELKK